MLAKIANKFPSVNELPEMSFIPMITATPTIEIKVPIQKILLGFSFRKSKAPIPTQRGARLASKVDIEAFESIIEVFHKAMSQAKNTPQMIAIFTP